MSVRFDELLPRALDSDLAGPEEREFLALLEDPGHAAAFAESSRLDRELTGLLAAPVSDETLVRLVFRDLDRGPDRGHTTRILAVLDRVRRDAGTRRKATRRSSRSTTSGPASWWLAAALFAAALLVAVLSPSAPPKPRKETVRVPIVIDPAPPPPAPLPPEAPAPQPKPERAPEPLLVPPPPPPRPEAPVPAAPPAEPAPAPRTVSPTVVSVARVEHVEGAAGVKEGQELLAGHDLDTGTDGIIVLRLPDATRIDLAPGTQLRGLSGAAEEKRFTLQRGKISADVAPRAPGARPFVVHTPEAEVAVLGTRFSLSLTPGLTRLDVDRGRVKLSRRSDGVSAEVPAGQAAVTGPGIRPVARPCPGGAPLIVSFSVVDVDSGKPVAGLDPVPDEAVLVLASLPRINLRANVLPATTGSVVFGFDGNAAFNLQNGPPYAAYAQGDKGRYQAWTLAPGSHTLTATPYAAARGGGSAGGALTLAFRVR
ncbi:MAG: FecR domain-containing protein [Planctomycetaceae bacterium]|nr:FecR domain-containing protein [Planctomycetaceae bacterium]